MLISSASSVEIRETLPLSVLPSLRRRIKQSMRGKAVKQKKEEVMNMNFNLDQVPYLAEVDRFLMRD